MKAALVVVAIAFSSQVFSTEIAKEIWTCKSSNNENAVTSVKVTIDHTKGTSIGTLNDSIVSSEEIALNKKENAYTLEGGVYPGHDSYEYSVNLLRNRLEDWEYGSETALRGQALVKTSGFIDCVGEFEGAEILNCSVEVVRK
jgi:hypothetical protein